MKLILNTDNCTGCGVCVRTCPQQILEVNKNKKLEILDESRCMGCFGCEDECNFHAIRLLRTHRIDLEPEIEPKPELKPSYDVIVIGAGPSGLGAAIECARNGLDVCVCERLPNRKMSHHTDGGMLFGFPGIKSNIMTFGESSIDFPNMDISLPSSFAKNKFDRLGIIGPKGMSTGDKFPSNVSPGLISNKDLFVHSLADEAEKHGATLWYNSKVIDFIREDEKICGVLTEAGEQIRAKVVISGDGILGKMSQKAGLPNNAKINQIAHASVLSFEYEGDPDIPKGLYYLEGEMDQEPDMPPALAGIGISDTIHVLIVFVTKKKSYNAPKAMDYYLQKFLENDERVHKLLGKDFHKRTPLLLNGCRGIFRKTNLDIVRDGFISIGDAFVGGGELGNVPALGHGVATGKVVVTAFAQNDFSQKALQPAANYISSSIVKTTEMNGAQKMLPMNASEEELVHYFEVMKDANYPVMIFGSVPQQIWMFTKLFIKNLWKLIRRPKLMKLMMGKS